MSKYSCRAIPQLILCKDKVFFQYKPKIMNFFRHIVTFQSSPDHATRHKSYNCLQHSRISLASYCSSLILYVFQKNLPLLPPFLHNHLCYRNIDGGRLQQEIATNLPHNTRILLFFFFSCHQILSSEASSTAAQTTYSLEFPAKPLQTAHIQRCTETRSHIFEHRGG